MAGTAYIAWNISQVGGDRIGRTFYDSFYVLIVLLIFYQCSKSNCLIDVNECRIYDIPISFLLSPEVYSVCDRPSFCFCTWVESSVKHRIRFVRSSRSMSLHAR